MVDEKLTKTEKKGMFFKPCSSCFLLFLSFPFVAKIVRIFRLIRSLRDVNSSLIYLAFKFG
jgi:hypothetical protein